MDKLKIDHTFVANVANSESDAAIATSIIDMAHNLKLSVLAEGVETAEQLEWLQRAGCHAIQGYYFSQPLSADEYTRYVEARNTAA